MLNLLISDLSWQFIDDLIKTVELLKSNVSSTLPLSPFRHSQEQTVSDVYNFCSFSFSSFFWQTMGLRDWSYGEDVAH